MSGDVGGLTAPFPYGQCKDCSVELADREAVNQHCHETVVPTGEAGVTARGHSVRIVNPTETEQRASRIRYDIERALGDVWETLLDHVERGDYTADEARAQMCFFDLEDGWDEYLTEDS